jgi:hypothetical protein
MNEVRIVAAKKQANQWLESLSRNLLYALALLVLAVCYLQYRVEGWAWTHWDLMLISGLLAFMIALSLAQTIPARMTQTLERLTKRGVFELSEVALEDLHTKMEKRAQRYAQVGAGMVALVILVSFLAAFRSYIIYEIPLTVLEMFLGAVAGYYIGQMIAYGTLGGLVQREKISVVPKYGHIDRAAGLKPIGDYYFFQAMIVAIPCVYIAVWWFIIPWLPWYSLWRNPYLGLLAVALIFEILSFLVPMWIFHLIMQEQKIKALGEADELSKKIVELENRILMAAEPKETNDLQKQLDFQQQKYWEIEHMPTWPVDAQTRRRFTVNNLLLFLPFFSDLVRTSAPWKKFLDVLVKFLTAQ